MKIPRVGKALLVVILSGIPWLAPAQTQRVTVDVREADAQTVFTQIKEQTGLNFVYNADQLRSMPRITLRMENATVEAVLEQMFKGTAFEFRFEEGIVIVKRKVQEVKESVTITGLVTDKDNIPLPGVTVQVGGTSAGTATNEKGRFSITLPMTKGKLRFSFVGYKSQEVEFSATRDTLHITLEEEATNIDEVVVTGYGNVAKGNYTGASTTVKAEDILMAGVSSIDQMLQGVVPGMLVMNKTGLVGASPKVRVRGTSTLLGSQEPVWVVDGVIQRDPQPFDPEENTKFSVDADDIKELAGNAISWLNPNDIESITVLKDASATAIYGSQAANGVIVITTKKAQAGRVQVSYSGDFSIGQRPRYGLYDLMNSAERMQLSKEIYEEKRKADYATNTDLKIGFESLLQRYRNKEATIAELREEYDRMAQQNTDWFDILFRNSFNHSHNLSISGGSEKMQNRTSFGFSQENGEARGNGMTQFTATSNTTVNLWERVTLNLLLNGSIREVSSFAYGVDPFTYAYETSRVIPCYNEDGSLYYHEKRGTRYSSILNTNIFSYNILNEKANTGSENKTRTWGATIDLNVRILSGLQYQGLFSYALSSSDTKQWASERSFYITQTRGYEYGAYMPSDEETGMSPLPQGGLLETDLTNTGTITVRNSLVYDQLFKDKHRLTLQLGIETISVKTKGETNSRYGYLPERGETFALPPASYISGGLVYDNTTIAQGAHTVVNKHENTMSEYGMAVYAYNDKYVVNVSGRVDASNRFGQDKNKRFQPTWSVGLKWRVANEAFASGKWWLNSLDIYGSYGYQGNAVSSVSPELITSFTNVQMYNSANGQSIVSVANPDLGWEKTKTWNIGVDGAFLKGRLNFTFNYYKKISDVLSSRAIPYENGDANGIVLGSTMKNEGYDLVVNVVPVQAKDFIWQLSMNTSVTNNSVETTRTNTFSDYTSGTCLIAGHAFSTFHSYIFTGLDEEYGQPLFKNMTQYGGTNDFSADESVDDITDFMEVSGKLTPDFSGGFNTMFKYKNISLYALFAVQWGGHDRLPDLYDTNNGDNGIPKAEENLSKKLKNRWKNPGDQTDIPSLPGTGREYVYIPAVKNLEIEGYHYRNRYEAYNLSSACVANTDFIRCRQLSLSYDITGKWMERIGLANLQVKASMTNPFMWVSDKKWDGLDPETGNWPTRRMTSFSLKVMF